MPELNFLPIKSKDVGDLVVFLSKNFENKSIDFWRRRLSLIWDENPAFSAGEGRGIVLCDDSKIVGAHLRFPTKFQLQGKEISASNIWGISIHPDFRRQGLGRKIRAKYLEIANDTIAFVTTSMEYSCKINESLGFRLFPRGTDLNSETYSIVVLNYSEVLLKSKEIVANLVRKSGIVSRWLCLLIRIYQSFRMIPFHRRLRKNMDLVVQELEQVDNTFDELWQATRHQYSNTNIRTPEVINWYLNPKNESKKRLYACHRADKLLGYILIMETEVRDIKTHYCVDLWYDEREGCIIEKLMQFAIRRAKSLSFGMVLFPHFSKRLADYYSKLGLIKMKSHFRNDYFKTTLEVSDLIIENNSYFVELQGDRGL